MKPTLYRIVVQAGQSERFAATFNGMTTEPGGGETALVGQVGNHAHLCGILERLRDFGLEMLRIEKSER